MKRLLGIAGLVLGATAALLAQQLNNVSVYTIKDVAGVLPPTEATSTPQSLLLQAPDAVAADKAGNVYVTDTGGHRVWKIDTNNKVSVVIGNGFSGNPTAGRAANTQQINQPAGLAVDGAGNLYVSDRNQHKIWKIDTSGVVTLFAGLTTNGRYNGDGHLAVQADINVPRGMAINPVDGNLYFADSGNQRIRKIDLKSGIITTVAGSTTSGSNTGIGTGAATYSGDGGLAVFAHLNAPEDVAFDAFGDMFIADTGNSRIRMVTPNGIITTVAGRALTNKEQGLDDNGSPIPVVGCTLSACLSNSALGKPNFYTTATAPYPSTCVTVRGSSLPVAASGSNVACALVGDGRDPLSALLANPSQIVVDSNNNVIFTDRGNARIRMLLANPVPAGTNSFAGFSAINTIVGTGSNANSGDGGLGRSAGISTGTNGLALNSNGVLLFTDRTNNRVRTFDTVSGLVGTFAGANPPLFNGPTGIAVDSAGNLYVADSGNNVIRKVDTSGNVTIIAGARSGGNAAGEGIDPLSAALNNPTGIWVDPSGSQIYFADVGSNRIRRISAGSINTVAGCVYTLTPGSNAAPQQQCNFTSDGLPATITRLNLAGATTQNTKRFTGVAVDSTGTVYFTQPGDQIVRKVASDGTLVTIAGQFGVSGNEGEGGPAVNMLLSSPTGIAVDNAGNIIFAEGANFVAHIISNGIAYPLAGQPGQSGGDSEQSNSSGSIPVPAWSKRYRVIQGVKVDNNGNVFLADTSNNKISRIPYAAPAACIPAPAKTCAASTSTNTAVDMQFVDYRVAGNLGSNGGEFVFNYSAPANATAKASTVQVSFPTDIAVDSKGNVFFTDTANNMIREAIAPAPSK